MTMIKTASTISTYHTRGRLVYKHNTPPSYISLGQQYPKSRHRPTAELIICSGSWPTSGTKYSTLLVNSVDAVAPSLTSTEEVTPCTREVAVTEAFLLVSPLLFCSLPFTTALLLLLLSVALSLPLPTEPMPPYMRYK